VPDKGLLLILFIIPSRVVSETVVFQFMVQTVISFRDVDVVSEIDIESSLVERSSLTVDVELAVVVDTGAESEERTKRRVRPSYDRSKTRE
jgi:hypothetical protein